MRENHIMLLEGVMLLFKWFHFLYCKDIKKMLKNQIFHKKKPRQRKKITSYLGKNELE